MFNRDSTTGDIVHANRAGLATPRNAIHKNGRDSDASQVEDLIRDSTDRAEDHPPDPLLEEGSKNSRLVLDRIVCITHRGGEALFPENGLRAAKNV